MILGICGLIGSGKGATSDYLQNKYNFQHMSFADSLKEAIAAIFNWPFELLQGKTSESRIWREEVDHWWSNRLGIPNLTPRWVLQNWGTEVCRVHFHPDIWLASLERKISKSTSNIVIDDCRFVNEISAIRKLNGKLLQVSKPIKPIWYNTALQDLKDHSDLKMLVNFPKIHISEWGWIDQKFDIELLNSGSLDELYQKIDLMIQNFSLIE